jgi:RNA polymerase sigma factor (sigma-70 family)
MDITSLTQRYKQAADRPEKRRLRLEAVRTYTRDVRGYVRTLVPREHWDEGAHVGMIGVIVALEKYEPQSGEVDDAAFWTFARPFVCDEVQSWRRATPTITESQALEHKGLVHYFAKKYARPGVCADDLVQEGLMTLLAAARTWREDGGQPFGTYAGDRVRWQMSTVAKRESRRGISGRLSSPLGHVSSVDDPVGNEEGWTLLASLVGSSGEDVVEFALLRKAIARLSTLERRVLKGRLTGEESADLGSEIGRSRGRVWQLEVLIIEKLAGGPRDVS